MNNSDSTNEGIEDEQLSAVNNGSDGCFAVRTVTANYVLDLTARCLVRSPQTLLLGKASLTLTFDVDHSWVPLVELIDCAVGDKMRATVLVDGVEQPLRSTAVQAIRRVQIDSSTGGNPGSPW